MIEVNTRIHDKYSLEFKTSFVTRRKKKDNDFSAFMWFFLPNALDINKETYSKTQFYQDIKSNIRLITPKYLLRDIVAGDDSPLERLRDAFKALASTPTHTNTREYEYQIKMFSAITHSSARDACDYLCNGRHLSDELNMLIKGYVADYTSVLREYRTLHAIIAVPTVTDSTMSFYTYGDEYASNMMLHYCVDLLDYALRKNDDNLKPAISLLQDAIRAEKNYRIQHGYLCNQENDPNGNRDVIFRHRVLKKYVDSDLFLNVPRKKDGVLVEQLYLGIAAGLAMMFATVVSFHFQQEYGNFTLPFFIVLVLSYMIKDRIKELSRYYFAHRIGSKFFDNKAEILIKEQKIGTFKEGMDFISRSNIPDDVRRLRYTKRLVEAENRLKDEKVLLYRMNVHINREKLVKMTPYETMGINDIVRFNIISLLKKMDNPTVEQKMMRPDGSVAQIMCDKLYYINIVLQLSFDGATSLSRFRVAVNRNGIDQIYKLDDEKPMT
ncbi:MAG: hypothetical protein HUK11_05410 [Muribaculaceae bacterium]|nr:hypothetical protein [Muribaculaceae bacterium]